MTNTITMSAFKQKVAVIALQEETRHAALIAAIVTLATVGIASTALAQQQRSVRA